MGSKKFSYISNSTLVAISLLCASIVSSTPLPFPQPNFLETSHDLVYIQNPDGTVFNTGSSEALSYAPSIPDVSVINHLGRHSENAADSSFTQIFRRALPDGSAGEQWPAEVKENLEKLQKRLKDEAATMAIQGETLTLQMEFQPRTLPLQLELADLCVKAYQTHSAFFTYISTPKRGRLPVPSDEAQSASRTLLKAIDMCMDHLYSFLPVYIKSTTNPQTPETIRVMTIDFAQTCHYLAKDCDRNLSVGASKRRVVDFDWLETCEDVEKSIEGLLKDHADVRFKEIDALKPLLPQLRSLTSLDRKIYLEPRVHGQWSQGIVLSLETLHGLRKVQVEERMNLLRTILDLQAKFFEEHNQFAYKLDIEYAELCMEAHMTCRDYSRSQDRHVGRYSEERANSMLFDAVHRCMYKLMFNLPPVFDSKRPEIAPRITALEKEKLVVYLADAVIFLGRDCNTNLSQHRGRRREGGFDWVVVCQSVRKAVDVMLQQERDYEDLPLRKIRRLKEVLTSLKSNLDEPVGKEPRGGRKRSYNQIS
ncbi:hypothetical protein H0H93_007105 [Arthromyces matolae]|nr:hypothetical protein H0H93_007105 [Arthromyces matolae]